MTLPPAGGGSWAALVHLLVAAFSGFTLHSGHRAVEVRLTRGYALRHRRALTAVLRFLWLAQVGLLSKKAPYVSGIVL